MFDPPEGWKYGFPKALPMEYGTPFFNMRRWLIDNGYPKKLIPMALIYSRMWVEEIETTVDGGF